VGRRYVQHINRTYGRTGTLWDSRYKSSLVQAETYLLLCQRYTQLMPVFRRSRGEKGEKGPGEKGPGSISAAHLLASAPPRRHRWNGGGRPPLRRSMAPRGRSARATPPPASLGVPFNPKPPDSTASLLARCP
jgi:hypothetical protein